MLKCNRPQCVCHPTAHRKPIISVVITGEQSYNVTITPVTTTPLISYPAGGWGVIGISASNSTAQDGTYCA